MTVWQISDTHVFLNSCCVKSVSQRMKMHSLSRSFSEGRESGAVEYDVWHIAASLCPMWDIVRNNDIPSGMDMFVQVQLYRAVCSISMWLCAMCNGVTVHGLTILKIRHAHCQQAALLRRHFRASESKPNHTPHLCHMIQSFWIAYLRPPSLSQ